MEGVDKKAKGQMTGRFLFHLGCTPLVSTGTVGTPHKDNPGSTANPELNSCGNELVK